MDAAYTLDMPTLVVARIASVVVFAVAVPIMTMRRNRPETVLFCWSLVMAICSWGAILAAVGTRNILLTALYTGCISGVVSLQWAAVVTLTGRKLHLAWFALPPALVVVAVLGLRLNSENAAHFNAIVLSLQLAAAAVFVLRNASKVVRYSTAFLMASGYAISFCSAIARPIEAILMPGVRFSPLSGEMVNSIPFIASYVGTTIIILSWLAALKDRAESTLADLAFRDELTQLSNRRALREQGRKLWTSSRWQGTAFTLVALDLDHFKQVNDLFGHDEGDRVLATFGEAIRAAQPTPRIAARMGGEEFCLIYIGVDARTAHDFVEALRDSFGEKLRLPNGLPVRFSAGIAQSSPADESINSVFRRADDALYNAKASGRDCTIIGSALAA
ncbi:GGDEF domain-containing protein [Devosia rhizoryzae]|uniref:diguanylate cyclase n=1 Tax=Devosia rhizoryzae TaxID=2774137 RepID=A0ABX7C9I5_9HYPH|nr:GGDEF domain-containing protein [Devosia rhizoryzae]QQR40883.1 GGDEF domain-containing protein [Devosia rhizoryzae]